MNYNQGHLKLRELDILIPDSIPPTNHVLLGS